MGNAALFLFLVLGFMLLGSGAELLVRGSSALALRLGMSPLLVGLTIVAFGTSAPELAVNIQSTAAGQSALALGNVVGSNIANIGLILGITALINPIRIKRQLIRKQIPLVVFSSIFMWLLLIDGELSVLDGVLLTSGFFAFLFSSYRQSVAEPAEANSEINSALSVTPALSINVALTIAGMILLILGSTLFVDNALVIARTVGVSEAVIGLTLVAIGTSIPELATSLFAALKGKTELAIGNIIGSNLFNIPGILGLTALIGTVSAAQFS